VTLPLSDLERAARAAQERLVDGREGFGADMATIRAVAKFHKKATPATVLAMIERIRALERDVDALANMLNDLDADSELYGETQLSAAWLDRIRKALNRLERARQSPQDPPKQVPAR